MFVLFVIHAVRVGSHAGRQKWPSVEPELQELKSPRPTATGCVKVILTGGYRVFDDQAVLIHRLKRNKQQYPTARDGQARQRVDPCLIFQVLKLSKLGIS